ncbi:hypothetical protein K8089_15820 [Aequorivita sp. F47161]|uniref:Uncharacterized protein n=1 Tax=Aequorivita vitellina TaxID=2874475 RepID=A0A9X1QXD7_9FLAO|nr:hypothetical protein [Aequorivita vitellina]MCG2420490.1 hypothetical protein [Aequorivita vitellina]
MRNLIKILILTIAFGISNSIFAKVETDTITTWKLSKDSELLIQSNHFNSIIYTVELNTTDEYENLNVSVFYDFNSDIISRKIKFLVGKKTIAEFDEDNNSRLPFSLPKKEIDKVITGFLNEPIAIVYTDSISENAILVGFVIFKKK